MNRHRGREDLGCELGRCGDHRLVDRRHRQWIAVGRAHAGLLVGWPRARCVPRRRPRSHVHSHRHRPEHQGRGRALVRVRHGWIARRGRPGRGELRGSPSPCNTTAIYRRRPRCGDGCRSHPPGRVAGGQHARERSDSPAGHGNTAICHLAFPRPAPAAGTARRRPDTTADRRRRIAAGVRAARAAFRADAGASRLAVGAGRVRTRGGIDLEDRGRRLQPYPGGLRLRRRTRPGGYECARTRGDAPTVHPRERGEDLCGPGPVRSESRHRGHARPVPQRAVATARADHISPRHHRRGRGLPRRRAHHRARRGRPHRAAAPLAATYTEPRPRNATSTRSKASSARATPAVRSSSPTGRSSVLSSRCSSLNNDIGYALTSPAVRTQTLRAESLDIPTPTGPCTAG